MESGADTIKDTRARDNDGPDADAHGILHGGSGRHGEGERGREKEVEYEFFRSHAGTDRGSLASRARARFSRRRRFPLSRLRRCRHAFIRPWAFLVVVKCITQRSRLSRVPGISGPQCTRAAVPVLLAVFVACYMIYLDSG